MSDRVAEVRSRASDQKAGMTISELQGFVVDAMQMGISGDTPVKVSIGWRQNIQELRVSGAPE